MKHGSRIDSKQRGMDMDKDKDGDKQEKNHLSRTRE
jgi:hypothetical protein